jgi:2-polyprenyl-6-hydroxyphenyl methylase/3-demethylubiquinone-9 3-methyltransferase
MSINNNTIKVLDKFYPVIYFTDSEIEYLIKFPHINDFKLHDLWNEIDRIWAYYNLNNTKSLSTQDISSFYSHPIWILNGIFSSSDNDSRNHRYLIANYIKILNVKNICDFGGGFGELAITIAQNHNPNVQIDIIEPFPSKILKYRIENYGNIILKESLRIKYDVLIAQDVLEHVEYPVKLSFNLIKSLKTNGYIIFANCFYPYINAHLPKNFHLSRSFKWIMKSAGLNFISTIEGADHIQVYKKVDIKINYVMVYIKYTISYFFWFLLKIKKAIS